VNALVFYFFINIWQDLISPRRSSLILILRGVLDSRS